ncbi:hypothetical protein ACHQM5_003559 [Ranunculus cassubicifolius]
MGNCCGCEQSSSTIWGGEDWSSVISEKPAAKRDILHNKEKNGNPDSKKSLPGDTGTTASSTSIKIRITKEELKELLQKVEIQGISFEQALTQSMDVREQCRRQHVSLQPALPCINETE